MIDPKLPRLVLVTRKTPLELLLERHGTLSQARFYLEARGESLDEARESHERFTAALAEVQRAIPPDQRRVRVDRVDLDRFLFASDDVVVVIGQDGLVPNVAKYLAGQVTFGVNPDPERYDGVLCRHPARATGSVLEWLDASHSGFRFETRTMAVALREDGQRLAALNEIFIGHQSHQSARYRLFAGREERQSSSGIVCATGTGSTGWVLSISGQRASTRGLPKPEERRLAWFVREPFPSVATGTSLSFGLLEGDQELRVASEMGEGGVIFADGIETDRLEFLSGHTVRIRIAPEALRLVVPAAAAR